MAKTKEVRITEHFDITTEEGINVFYEPKTGEIREYLVSDQDILKTLKDKKLADLSVNGIIEIIENAPHYIPEQ